MTTALRLRSIPALLSVLLLPASVAGQVDDRQHTVSEAAPIAIGETFTIESRVLGESRRINVYRPYTWWDTTDAPLPVMYMPDGGVHEDFLHVMGLLQVSVM